MRYYLFLYFVMLMSTVSAQEIPNIQTDRPDQTECPFIVPKKYFQAEIGFAYENINNSENALLIPSCLFKYGISDKFELRLITEIEQVKNTSKSVTGLNPVIIGFKTNLFQEKGILPTISFIGHLSLPNMASSSNKSEYYSPSFRFTMQHTLSKKVSLGYNLGAEWDGFTPEPTFIYTVTSGFTLSKRIGCFIELYGFAPQHSSADHRIDGGVTFLINKDIQFDIAGGAGLSDSFTSYFIGTGISFRIK